MEAKKISLKDYLKVSRQACSGYAVTKIQAIVESFANSNEAIIEITWEEGEYKNGYGCYASIYGYLKRNRKTNMYTVRVLDKGKRVFLVNNHKFEKAMEG